MNRQDAEIAQFLHSLLNHDRQCRVKGCPSCQTLHEILGVVKDRIFAAPVYPEHGIHAARTAARA